jgi:hypothetical protein
MNAWILEGEFCASNLGRESFESEVNLPVDLLLARSHI